MITPALGAQLFFFDCGAVPGLLFSVSVLFLLLSGRPANLFPVTAGFPFYRYYQPSLNSLARASRVGLAVAPWCMSRDVYDLCSGSVVNSLWMSINNHFQHQLYDSFTTSSQHLLWHHVWLGILATFIVSDTEWIHSMFLVQNVLQLYIIYEYIIFILYVMVFEFTRSQKQVLFFSKIGGGCSYVKQESNGLCLSSDQKK